jgi:hypothetical protein
VPNLLFPSPSLVGAGTFWSTSGMWQVDVASNLLLQAVTLFLWHRQQLLVLQDQRLCRCFRPATYQGEYPR